MQIRHVVFLALACLTMSRTSFAQSPECAALATNPVDPAAQPITNGNFEYKINGAFWGTQNVGGDNIDVLYVDVDARNVSTKPAGVPGSKLRSASGEEYVCVLKDFHFKCTFKEELVEPGATLRAYFVFDAPKAAYTLMLHGDKDPSGMAIGKPVDAALAPR